MLTDEKFNSLGDMVEADMPGSSVVEKVQIELLYGILAELRTLRKSNDQLAGQFNSVSAGGNRLVVDRKDGCDPRLSDPWFRAQGR